MKTKRLIMTVLCVALLSGCGLGNQVSRLGKLIKNPWATLVKQAWIVVEPPDPEATDVRWRARHVGSHEEDPGKWMTAEYSSRKVRAAAMTLHQGQRFWCDYVSGNYGLVLLSLEIEKQGKRGPLPPPPPPPPVPPPPPMPPGPDAVEILRPAEEGGTVAGTVLAIVDGVGGILSGVDVWLRSHSGDVNRVNSTDDFGGYSFHNVRPGDYGITLELDGYESVNLQLHVESGVALTMPAVIMFQDD